VTDDSKAPIVERILIQVGPDITLTVDKSTFVPTPKQTKQWHAYVRKRARAIQGNGVVHEIVAVIRSIASIPDGGFTDSGARWGWQNWAEGVTLVGPGVQDLIDKLTYPYTLRGDQAIPPTIPHILDLAIHRVMVIEELDDCWWLWVHALFVLHTPGDPTIVMPTPAKQPLESLTYRQADTARGLADDRDEQEIATLRDALMTHHAAGLSPYKIGTMTDAGRQYLELKGVRPNADRRQITNTIANAIRKQRPAKNKQRPAKK